ncbi:MAG: response regulator [bacterium]
MAKVLIVDDSTVQRTILKKFLEKEQHEIIGEAKNGQDAVALYKDLNPDIVLLDIVMPDANGIAILDQIINQDENANVIICSSTALRNLIIESIQIGAKGFLVKPITSETLLKTINKIMHMSKIPQNLKNRFCS